MQQDITPRAAQTIWRRSRLKRTLAYPQYRGRLPARTERHAYRNGPTRNSRRPARTGLSRRHACTPFHLENSAHAIATRGVSVG